MMEQALIILVYYCQLCNQCAVHTAGFVTDAASSRQHYTVCLRKNDTALACYNFHVHQPILIIFGRNVAKKTSSQMVLYFPTLPN